jgi:hypothetical protein
VAIPLQRLTALRVEELRALVGHLQALRYTTDELARLIHAEPDDLYVHPTLCSLSATGELDGTPGALAVVARLFCFAHAIDRSSLAKLPFELQAALEGLIVSDGEQVRGAIAIQELAGAYFFSDRLFENSEQSITRASSPGEAPLGSPITVNRAPDIAMPIHESSLRLLRALTQSDAYQSLLDIGVGCGVQSIVHGRRYAVVDGIDVSQRCIAFARINAAIQGLGVNYRQADVFTYESARRYDHIVFNTPWAIDYDARSELPSHHWLRFIDERLPELLSPDGECQLFCVLPLVEGAGSVEDALARLPGLARFRWRAQALDGAAQITTSEIQARRLRRGSLHVQRPGDEPLLLQYLIDRGVQAVIPIVLSLRR